MDTKVAAHLNYLLTMAHQIHTGAVNALESPSSSYTKIYTPLRKQAIEISKKYHETAIAAEIRNAARERRIARTNIHDRWTWLAYGDGTQDTVNAEVRDLCWPEVKAMIDADNARRLAAYEAYRIACEQGVAVPPMTEGEVAEASRG